MHLADLDRELRDIMDTLEGRASVAVSTPEGDIEVNAGDRLPAASLIKIPILLEAFRQAESREVDLDAPVPVSPGEKVGGTGVLTRLSDGLTLPLRDLMTLMIIVSDNTATNLVIDTVGMDRVNELCRELGAHSTLLDRRLMDLEARQAGHDNYTSTSDMVLLLREIAEGDLVSAKSRQEMVGILQGQQFNTKLPAMIPSGVPGDPVLAHKTGELPGVEHDAAIFVRDDSNVYVAGMLTELEDNRLGWDTLARIGRAVYDYMQ
ncbi:MAG: serine hydrolase [Clostridia bacterium]